MAIVTLLMDKGCSWENCRWFTGRPTKNETICIQSQTFISSVFEEKWHEMNSLDVAEFLFLAFLNKNLSNFPRRQISKIPQIFDKVLQISVYGLTYASTYEIYPSLVISYRFPTSMSQLCISNWLWGLNIDRKQYRT